VTKKLLDIRTDMNQSS